MVPGLKKIDGFSCVFPKSSIVEGAEDVENHAQICEACYDRDGCNGASSQYAPIAVVIAIPMAILKILSYRDYFSKPVYVKF